MSQYSFTGHRPNKLGGYGNDIFTKLVELATAFMRQTLTTEDIVISGMALGWDQAVAQAAVNLKIHLIAAIPCLNHDSMWPESSRAKYHALLASAEVKLVSNKPYHPSLMQRRNEWMVDNSTTLVALWNGTTSGTANCIKYAQSQNKPIINLWSQFT